MMDWQPIATAPKDGTHILVVTGGKRTTAFWAFNRRWSDDGWVLVESGYDDGKVTPEPTHWMGLPELPSK